MLKYSHLECDCIYVCSILYTEYQQLLAEPEGYRYQEDHKSGISIFRFDNPHSTRSDKLAFGFMTWHPNATLVRIDSRYSKDYIEAKLVSIRL